MIRPIVMRQFERVGRRSHDASAHLRRPRITQADRSQPFPADHLSPQRINSERLGQHRRRGETDPALRNDPGNGQEDCENTGP